MGTLVLSSTFEQGFGVKLRVYKLKAGNLINLINKVFIPENPNIWYRATFGRVKFKYLHREVSLTNKINNFSI